MNFGIIADEPFATYLAADAVSAHRLNDLRPRPIIYRRKWIDHTMPGRTDSPAFGFGRFFHCLALEGETAVDQRYATIPTNAPEDLRRYSNAKNPSDKTVAAMKWWNDFEAANPGKELVTVADVALAWEMLKSIRAKKCACDLLARGNPEVTFRYKLPLFAVQVRVDWFDNDAEGGPLLVNLKTVDSLEEFDGQFEKFAYYKSDALYRLVVAKLLNVETFAPQCINLVVEKNPPHECAVRVPDAEALDIGTREVLADLRTLTKCYESGKWPGEPDKRRRVGLSTWAVKRREESLAAEQIQP